LNWPPRLNNVPTVPYEMQYSCIFHSTKWMFLLLVFCHMCGSVNSWLMFFSLSDLFSASLSLMPVLSESNGLMSKRCQTSTFCDWDSVSVIRRYTYVLNSIIFLLEFWKLLYFSFIIIKLFLNWHKSPVKVQKLALLVVWKFTLVIISATPGGILKLYVNDMIVVYARCHVVCW